MFAWITRKPVAALVAAIIMFPILAGSAWRAVWLYTVEPNPTADTITMMNEFVAAGQPAGDNAWDVYYDLLINRFQASNNGSGSRLARLEHLRVDKALGHGAWDEIDRTPWLALIDEFREELDMLVTAADRRNFVKPYAATRTALEPVIDAPGALAPFWSVMLPDLGYLRRLGMVNAGVMRASAHAGDWRDAADRFRAGLRLGEFLTRQGTAIESLVGVAIMHTALYEAARIADELDIPPDAARMFIAEIDALGYSAAIAAARMFNGERRMALDAVQWTFSDDGAGDGVPLPAHVYAIDTGVPTRAERLQNIFGPMLYKRREETVRLTNDFFDLLTQSAADPQRRIDARPLERELFDTTLTGSLMELILPSLARVSRTLSVVESHLAGVRVMMRLEQAHAATGAWPDSLEAAFGAEALDPVSGEPFEYVRLADDPGGRAYELRLPWTGLLDARSLASIAVINEPREPLSVAPAPPAPASETIGGGENGSRVR